MAVAVAGASRAVVGGYEEDPRSFTPSSSPYGPRWPPEPDRGPTHSGTERNADKGGSRAVRGAVLPALPRALTPGWPGAQSRGCTERPGVWERLLCDKGGVGGQVVGSPDTNRNVPVRTLILNSNSVLLLEDHCRE